MFSMGPWAWVSSKLSGAGAGAGAGSTDHTPRISVLEKGVKEPLKSLPFLPSTQCRGVFSNTLSFTKNKNSPVPNTRNNQGNRKSWSLSPRNLHHFGGSPGEHKSDSLEVL